MATIGRVECSAERIVQRYITAACWEFHDTRAHYLGATSTYGESFSSPVTLDVSRLNATLRLSTTPATFTVGQNITVTMNVSPFVSATNVTLSYTFDNKTFTPITTIYMTSGTMSFTWKADVPGTFTFVAVLDGGPGYNPVTAYLTIRRS